MASYKKLVQLMSEEETETIKLAQELTVKEMIAAFNNPKSAPAEMKVAVKATQLLTEAENNYLDRVENGTTDEGQNSNSNFTIDDWLKRAAMDYFMGD